MGHLPSAARSVPRLSIYGLIWRREVLTRKLYAPVHLTALVGLTFTGRPTASSFHLQRFDVAAQVVNSKLYFLLCT